MTAPYPTIPGVLKALLLALIAMICAPVVWGMRLIGHLGQRLSQHKGRG